MSPPPPSVTELPHKRPVAFNRVNIILLITKYKHVLKISASFFYIKGNTLNNIYVINYDVIYNKIVHGFPINPSDILLFTSFIMTCRLIKNPLSSPYPLVLHT